MFLLRDTSRFHSSPCMRQYSLSLLSEPRLSLSSQKIKLRVPMRNAIVTKTTTATASQSTRWEPKAYCVSQCITHRINRLVATRTVIQPNSQSVIFGSSGRRLERLPRPQTKESPAFRSLVASCGSFRRPRLAHRACRHPPSPKQRCSRQSLRWR